MDVRPLLGELALPTLVIHRRDDRYIRVDAGRHLADHIVGAKYVELPGELKIESRLTESDPQVLRQGMEMELVIVPFRSDEEGNEIMTFAFRPIPGTD